LKDTEGFEASKTRFYDLMWQIYLPVWAICPILPAVRITSLQGRRPCPKTGGLPKKDWAVERVCLLIFITYYRDSCRNDLRYL
jgi:hypothetical protein